MTANDGSLKEFQHNRFELVAQMGGGYPIGDAVEWWVSSTFRNLDVQSIQLHTGVFVVFNMAIHC